MLGPQQKIGVVNGDHTQNSAKVRLCSLMPEPFTLVCNGQTYQSTPAAVGDDAPPAGKDALMYCSVIEITGLSSLSRYPFTVSQAGVSRSDLAVTTAHKTGDRYSRIVLTCDNPIQHDSGGASQVGTDPEGIYAWVKRRCLDTRLPFVEAVDLVDDNTYADRAIVDDSAGTGNFIAATAASSPSEYAYAISYAAQMGLLSDITKKRIWSGRHTARQWVQGNCGADRQSGDHDWLDNSIGWAGDGGTVQGHAGYAAGTAMWAKLFTSMGPAALSANSLAWVKDFGDLLIVAPDRQTHAAGGDTGNNTRWGNTQIDEMLAAIAASSAKVVLIYMPNGWRYFSALGADIRSAYGSQEPLWNEAVDEANRFMTAASTGLMALQASKGFQFAFISGDYHLAGVNLHQNTDAVASGGLAESFYEFCIGTATGSTNMPLAAGIVQGTVHDGSTKLWVPPNRVALTTTNPRIYDFWAAEVTVFGDLDPLEWEVKLIDRAGNSPTRARWRYGVNGNLPLANGGARKAA